MYLKENQKIFLLHLNKERSGRLDEIVSMQTNYTFEQALLLVFSSVCFSRVADDLYPFVFANFSYLNYTRGKGNVNTNPPLEGSEAPLPSAGGFGSCPGRTRTYNLLVNSQRHHHCATGQADLG